jgi:type IV pilus assembly protein PilM
MGLFSKGVHSLALDWGRERLKLVEIEHNKDGPKLKKFIVKKVVESGVKDDKSSWKRSSFKVLKSIVNDAKFATSDLKLIISGSNAIIKFLSLPYLEDEELQESVFWEVKDMFSIPLTDLIIDYEVLFKTEAETKVIVVAAYKQLVVEKINLLAKLGFEVQQVEVAPLVLQRILDSSCQQDKLAIIDIGAHETGMSILSRGNLDFRRVFPLGGQNFTDEIREEKDLTFREAEEYKQQEAGVEFDLIHNSLTSLLKKISFSIHYWQQNNGQLDRLFLTGGGARLKGLDEFITEQLDIEVEVLANLSKFEFEVEGLSFHLLKQKLPYLSISLASSLRGARK